MKLKILRKQFLTTFLIIVFSLAIMMMILSFVLNNNVANSKQNIIVKTGDIVAQHIKNQDPNEKEFSKIICGIAQVSEIEIFVTDYNNKLLVCSCGEWQENESCMHSQKEIIKKNKNNIIKNDRKNVFLDDLGIYRKPHYINERIIYSDSGEKQYTIYVTATISSVGSLIYTVLKLYIISALIPIIIMFVAIYIMNYKMVKPLKLMSEAAKAMAKGDFSKRIPVISDDEIGELAVSFNMLTNTLSRSEGMRRSFVANVSHELKTPMTTIGGFIDGILDGTIEQSKQQYYLNIVSQEIKRLSVLVHSMLSMSRLESGEFELKPSLFDIRELIFSIIINQEQRIDNGKIQITGLDELSEISINADKELIHQVIYNLIDNAIKFTNEGGEIKFSLKNEVNKTVFAISNTGKGIPKKDIPYIFDRFYKVDKSRSVSKNSTGLGLYIVKTIVTAHGGTISVTGQENVSTTFKVSLPNINQ